MGDSIPKGVPISLASVWELGTDRDYSDRLIVLDTAPVVQVIKHLQDLLLC